MPNVDISRELRYIGPLFVGLFIILWIRRGPLPFFMMFVFPVMLIVYVPPFLAASGIFILFLYFIPRYRLTTIIFILSFLGSGVLLEPVPIYYPGPYPPPPVYIPPIMFTPLMSMFASFSTFFWGFSLLSVFTLLLFSVLPFLTAFTFHRVVERKMDPVKAMVVLVILLMIWTFYIFPLDTGMGSSYILTPLPLGPLVALTILPWIPEGNTDTQQSQNY